MKHVKTHPKQIPGWLAKHEFFGDDSWAMKLGRAFKDAFEKLGRADEYDYDNPEHQNFVIQKARERQGVFA